MRKKRLAAGVYKLWVGRGKNKRQFLLQLMPRNHKDGWKAGWLVREMLPKDGQIWWSIVTQGAKTYAAAKRASRLEVEMYP